ncbi:nucleoside hydrolase [Piscinibacter aquaticus]|uniref:Nucleoside hydrolase n=1 Tax=Piscinibacter aquaticus TaxID=392597 RepID=A0A5C6U0C6_9BURK|nr:nucleoside hydrolase [Piscinibacter aquaticus]
MRVVIDTDAANEIDDPFAIAWALLRPDRLKVEAFYATPYSFAHRRAQMAVQQHPQFDPPDIGMERSHAAIVEVFDKLGLDAKGRVHRGSTRYIAALDAPERSAATDHLIATAMAMPDDEPLYVVAIGCATNVANALLIEPRIAERIVVVWTSGYPSHAPQVNDSFNLEQDLLASQWLLDSGVPHVYLPGFHVGAQLRLSLPEMERWVRGRGAIGEHLFDLYTHNPLWPLLGIASFEAHSWVIWDLICIAGCSIRPGCQAPSCARRAWAPTGAGWPMRGGTRCARRTRCSGMRSSVRSSRRCPAIGDLGRQE